MDEPVFSWKDGAAWERGGLYKTDLVFHNGKFYMFYNAKDKDERGWKEQIGAAVSDDLLHWKRLFDHPVVPVSEGAWDSTFAADPQVFYDSKENQWVMFYYGFGNLSACDGIAVSRDLLSWTKFPVPVLTIGGRAQIDSIHAHKPGIVFHGGALYHFYCACRPHMDGDPTDNRGEFRCISVARSRKWDES